jgi:hypothetical protein
MVRSPPRAKRMNNEEELQHQQQQQPNANSHDHEEQGENSLRRKRTRTGEISQQPFAVGDEADLDLLSMYNTDVLQTHEEANTGKFILPII